MPPPAEPTTTVAVPSTKTLFSGIALGFLLALLVGSALYWWANRPVPATLTLEPPAPVSTRENAEPVSAPLPVQDPVQQPSRSVGVQSLGAVLINLNTATLAELETLPGIGPAKALAIVAGRPYAAIDDLDDVAGIGPATIEELRSLVTTD